MSTNDPIRDLMVKAAYQVAIETATNDVSDAIGAAFKDLPDNVRGLAILDTVSVLSCLMANGICRILGDEPPKEYDQSGDLERFAAIVLHHRSLSRTNWSQVFTWAANDFEARYNKPSLYAQRLIAKTAKGKGII